MPAHRKRPLPTERMVALLAAEKARLLDEKGHVVPADFDAAWNTSWAIMVTERAWPHNSVERRQWRGAMIATRSEARAAFLGRPTAFSRLVHGLNEASGRWNFALDSGDVPKVIIGAIQAGYTICGDEQGAVEEMAA